MKHHRKFIIRLANVLLISILYFTNAYLSAGELFRDGDPTYSERLAKDFLEDTGIRSYYPLAANTNLNQASKLRFEADMAKLRAVSTVKPIIRYRNKFPRSIQMSVKSTDDTVELRARNFLRQFRELYFQQDPDNDLVLKRVNENGLEQVIFSQKYLGIPVFGAELSVSMHEDNIQMTLGELIPTDRLKKILPNVKPSVTQEEAEAIARINVKAASEANLLSNSQLSVFDLSLIHKVSPNPRLVWRVAVAGKGGAKEIFVDAHTKKILFSLALVHQGGGSLHEFDFDLQDAEDEANPSDDNCYTLSNDVDVATEDWFNNDYLTDTDAVLVDKYARDTYAFYHDNFGRHSFDGGGAQVEVFIHSTVDDASWSAGLGCDTISFRTGWVDYEIMTHEFTHAVISYTSELIYKFEPGALNESYADIMAVVADRENGDINWLLAEDRTNNMGAIRNVQNPSIDRYSSYNPGTPNGDGEYPDNGGVHSNSGIGNKTAYLMAEGDTFNSISVNAMGLRKMRDLKYFSFVELPSNAQFLDAREVEIRVAQDWANNNIRGFTQQDVCSVRNAWAAVEVGSPDYNCDGVEDSPDIDGDSVHSSEDNCPLQYNPDQSDSDSDGVGDRCDNCVFHPNPDQADYDKDGMGDACDNDDDNDGCLDENDDEQFNDSQVTGTYTCLDCPGTNGESYGFVGIDSDGDGLLNCEDDDDDNDGTLDEVDSCPIGALPGAPNQTAIDGGECKILKACNSICFKPLRGLDCKFGNCFEWILNPGNRINPDPTIQNLLLKPRLKGKSLILH